MEETKVCKQCNKNLKLSEFMFSKGISENTKNNIYYRSICIYCTRENARNKQKEKKKQRLCTGCSKKLDESNKTTCCKECSKRKNKVIKKHRDNIIKQKLCISCHKTVNTNNSKCKECRDKENNCRKDRCEYRRENGLCTQCGKKHDPEYKKIICVDCNKKLRKRYWRNKKSVLRSNKKHNKDLKIAAFEAYGGAVCNCQGCNEKRLNFLAIDHINNDGYEHRKNQGKGVKIYRWLKKNNYPEGYQVLCHNCNWSKHANGGKCDHELEGYIHPEKRQDCKAIVYNSFDNYINGKGEELIIT